MVTLFVLCVALIVFAYAGYPLTMKYLSDLLMGVPVLYNTKQLSITVIIAAANEESKIYDKLMNTFDTHYSSDCIQVIVTLDGCTDDTGKQISMFVADHPQYQNQITVITNEKGGKEAAQLAAVNHATSDICIFTDVATVLDLMTYSNLVRNFADPSIGAVDGMSRVESDGHSSEGIYLKYENKIREWESNVSGLVTMGGCLFAARTKMLQGLKRLPNGENYPGFVPDLQSDFRTALASKTFGYKAVLDTDAVATFKDGAESKEFGRKHRTVVRGINNLFHNLHLLNPMNYGLFSYALFCHKLLKWLVPFFMIGALVSNWWLSYEGIGWLIVFWLHGVFYLTAWLGYSGNLDNKVTKIVSFFVISNLAILKAWWSYLVKGERFVMWSPTKR